jgi:hypothetical protein
MYTDIGISPIARALTCRYHRRTFTLKSRSTFFDKLVVFLRSHSISDRASNAGCILDKEDTSIHCIY